MREVAEMPENRETRGKTGEPATIPAPRSASRVGTALDRAEVRREAVAGHAARWRLRRRCASTRDEWAGQDGPAVS